jgi:hypothetical protein
MVSITLSVPEEIRKLMKRYPEMNWSGFVRACIMDKAKKLEMKEELLKKLENEKEHDLIALKIGDKIREGMLKKYKRG